MSNIEYNQKEMTDFKPQIIAPTLLNGWHNYGNGFEGAKVYKYPSGRVECSGLIAGNFAQIIFTLPAGWRPAGRQLFSVCANDVLVRVDITPDGNVFLSSGGSVGRQGSGWVSLNGISFYAGN